MKYYGAIAEPMDLVNKAYVDADYTLIEEITLSEDTVTVSRSKTPDGVDYRYKKVLALFTFPSGGTGNAYVWFQPNKAPSSCTSVAYIRMNESNAALYMEANASFFHTCGISGLGEYSSMARYGNIVENSAGYTIDNVRFSANGVFKAGTKIAIYGVRA